MANKSTKTGFSGRAGSKSAPKPCGRSTDADERARSRGRGQFFAGISRGGAGTSCSRPQDDVVIDI